jgi:hypothetical protein
MKLSDKDRNSLTRRVGGSAQDAALAVNCMTVFCQSLRDLLQQQQEQKLNYDVVASYDDNELLFAIRFTQGVSMLTHTTIDAIHCQSPSRVIAVDTDRDGNIIIVLLRSVSSEQQARIERNARSVFVVPHRRKRRQIACDYDASGIDSTDDRSNIDLLVDEVYHMRERLPASMNFWFEHIRSATGAEHGGCVLPLTRKMAGGGGDDDESESIVIGPTVGYSLCFTNVGAVHGAFLRHLHSKFPSIVVSSYVWIEPPHKVADDPVLVVNIRASSSIVTDVRHRVVAAIPRGTVVVAKRARYVK